MLNSASPAVRTTVVESRSLAIRGSREDALSRLLTEIDHVGTDRPIDRLVLLLASAEILHLDCDDEGAFAIFAEGIDPLLSYVPEQVAIAVAYNRSDVAMAMLRPDDFYGVVDRSHIADVDLWHYRAFFEVHEAAAAGKHYDSLPAVWEELLRTYRQGCWRPFRAAARLMAHECLQLGWPNQAVFYALTAGQKETAQQVGLYLVANGTRELLDATVNTLLELAHLGRHFVTGCEIATAMVDAIPDSHVSAVAKWLLLRASMVPRNIGERDVFEHAWKALVAISPRLDAATAQAVANAATEHDVWNAQPERNRVITTRDQMTRALARCAGELERPALEELLRSALPLAGERKQDHDYPDVINLLCRLGECGGDETKSRLRAHLFPKGVPLNWILLQVAPFFEVEITNTDAIAKDAERVAGNIRLQVQRTSSDCAVTGVDGSFGYLTVDVGSERLYVHMVNTMDVEAIVRLRHKVPADAFGVVVEAILSMIGEEENLLSNRIALVQSIGDIGDVCDDKTAADVYEALAALASGDVVEPTHVMSAAEAANPLNPYKMGSGKPADLQGVAIYALACIERDKPGVYGRHLDRLVEGGLASVNADVRTLSYAAAREKPTLSEAEFTSLVLGTRDSESKAACAAFAAISSRKDAKWNRPQWRLLIHSIGLATQSRDSKLRRAAAHTCAKFAEYVPNTPLRESLTELREVFGGDTCYSVRRAAALK